MPHFIDAHCHLDAPQFRDDFPRHLNDWQRLGVSRFVVPAVSVSSWPVLQRMALGFDAVYACLGLHPWFIDGLTSDALDQLDAAIVSWRSAGLSDRLVAIGECGLDRLRGDFNRQQLFFEGHIHLAKTHALPLVVHAVRAHGEVLQSLKRHDFKGRVLVHGFSGNLQQVKQYAAAGIYLGVGGAITYPGANKTRTAIAQAPLTLLILETDAPDMPPLGVAKGHNSPANLPRIFDALCQLREEPPHVIAEQLWANACKLYGWSINWPG